METYQEQKYETNIRTGSMNVTGYLIIINTTFVSELFENVYPRTGEPFEGEPEVRSTTFIRTLSGDLLLSGTLFSDFLFLVEPVRMNST